MWKRDDVFLDMQQFCVGKYERMNSAVRVLILSTMLVAPTAHNKNLYLTFNYAEKMRDDKHVL